MVNLINLKQFLLVTHPYHSKKRKEKFKISKKRIFGSATLSQGTTNLTKFLVKMPSDIAIGLILMTY